MFTWRRHSAPVSEHSGLSLSAKNQCATGLAHVAGLLHEEFDALLGAPAVDECLAEVTGRFADATVLSFVPLLVRRYAREELLARVPLAQPQGQATEVALLSPAT